MKRPDISLIAAMAENRVIGCKGSIPWHLPADLQRFRQLTMGHPLIVGRKTFESIGGSLPGRTIIVVTRQVHYRPEGCLVAKDLDEALSLAGDAEEIFVGGGGTLYRQALPLANRIYLTLVPGQYEGDAWFPDLPVEFEERAREEVPGEKECFFLTFERTGRQ